MAHYLVKAKPEDLQGLRQKLDNGEIKAMRPFGGEMDQALRKARRTPDGMAVWEEQCFCSPPLNQERSVLDQHFSDLTTETVNAGSGWQRIDDLPPLWDRT
jgi:hypothetical protein